MFDIKVIETSSLGDRSYLATDGTVAVVVDPQRDVDRFLAVAGRLGVPITHVAETHLHNDYVSGGLELARLTGATYLVVAAEDVAFERVGVSDGDVIEVSPRMRLRVVATPGHTFHHLSYVLEDPQGPVGVFTGGSLLFGTTGRTDLLGSEHTVELARAQYASVRTLGELLPDGTQVWPTHGFGSFCAVGQVSGDASTIGQQRAVNPVFRLARDEFVKQTLAGMGDYPAYYVHMGVINAAGPAPVDLRPARRIDKDELAGRLRRGEWVVDLRARKAYFASHLAGTISLGLDGPMATWVGWLIDWGAPITLVGETGEQIARAQRELVRIGIDRVAGAAVGSPERMAADPTQVESVPAASFRDLAAVLSGAPPADLPPADVVLDVRFDIEWNTSHISCAVHIPLPELSKRVADVPSGTVWVHCASGYRATAGASLLARAGRSVVVINDVYDNAARAGVPLTINANDPGIQLVPDC
ncbi:MBL fold metallo-hydrolase [Allokutzneria oryzae]|uniref:Rhodanese-like domain-containing protein n=1 Tax=Allokutzneria oryzae TaxID=1378989 RepID=A0ABV6A0D8_9PSEU